MSITNIDYRSSLIRFTLGKGMFKCLRAACVHVSLWCRNTGATVTISPYGLLFPIVIVHLVVAIRPIGLSGFGYWRN